MKINLKNSKNQLSREEMKTIVAGMSILGDTAQVLCNDGTEHEIESCDTMEAACSSNGGAKICSGGGNGF